MALNIICILSKFHHTSIVKASIIVKDMKDVNPGKIQSRMLTLHVHN